jgi:hypothetical protein
MISVEGWAILVFLLVETLLMAMSLWVQVDDVYSWTQMKKKSKRMWRRNWKKFMTSTRRYFKCSKESGTILIKPSTDTKQEG